ncbi:hypothetical protein ACQJBY_042412 [Aegilops geniculata]
MAALRCYSSTAAVIVPRRKICTRASMDGSSSSESRQRASSSVSFACKVNKVYEDKNMGILCYTDENGELVCEGLDEGPRLTLGDMEKLTQEKESKNPPAIRSALSRQSSAVFFDLCVVL